MGKGSAVRNQWSVPGPGPDPYPGARVLKCSADELPPIAGATFEGPHRTS